VSSDGPDLTPFVDADALVEGLARRTGLDPASPFLGVLLSRLGDDPPPAEEDDDALARVQRAVDAVAAGRIVVVVDDTDRENEGDLVMAAEHVTADAVSFFLRHTSGVLCVALTGERCEQLALPLMVARNTESMSTAFTVSVDARHGVTTGISSSDRATTVHALIDPASQPDDIARPGHVFPLRAVAGGVLARPGHTEATVDLARLAGCAPAGLLCEVVSADKRGMAGRAELERLAARFDLPLVSVAELARYRRVREPLVARVSQGVVPTRHGALTARVYASLVDGSEHVAFVVGDPAARPADAPPVLVRLHSECLTGDVLGSLRCDCGTQLDDALEQMAADGAGVLVYLRGHEGRGIGIAQKIAAYALQDDGLDTVDANVRLGLPVDAREFDLGAQVLVDLGLRSVRLLTNNPAKERSVADQGIAVTRVPSTTGVTPHNAAYLEAKRTRMGHLLPAPAPAALRA
jgi:3,4-dihydroxy 2-butanone 4-phosphate synthase/GTP cyclohydrolase II